jgi:membrane associated rhomboid family serine protease
MLILPLHRPITRATFPIVTALLVLVNMLAHFGFQAGDDAKVEGAVAYYVQSGLGAREADAYERWLGSEGRRDGELTKLQGLSAKERPRYVAEATLFDAPFQDAMRSGRPFADRAAFDDWRRLRTRYDAMLADIGTMRLVMRTSEVDLVRMVGSTFLHADAMHLVGNMVFLVAVGLLVEGAIGAWRFLGVYLLGGLGASFASLAWHWGEAIGGLGASGAIAALMGAFCVVWGRQPVRFFYWVGVWFDYVRAPALWLFPAWLGWEVFNLFSDGGSNVAFEAHAGGLVAGALLGAILVATRQVRTAYVRDAGEGIVVDDRWARAQHHLGRLQSTEAEALLASLAAEDPDRIDVRIARYRAARNDGRTAQATERAREALGIAPQDASTARMQADLLAELDAAGTALPADLRLQAAARWIGAGALDGAEIALLGVPQAHDAAEQARLWFELALRQRDAGQMEAHARALRTLAERHPNAAQATKARFLLENA